MPTNGARIDFGVLIRALHARGAEDKTDGQLLEQFVNAHDESAFTVLVRRHGPMVLGVCRRILGSHADADDAFQATFLVLIRKAASLTSRAVLGDWLHGVARHTALKAKADAARRRAKEQAAARRDIQGDEARNDWLPLLDEEMSRLPEKYRLPIVLCDLEGRTRQEAAKRLGWPEGTVASRLMRGRALLAKRLIRTAQAVSGASALALAGGAAQAALPSMLVSSTVQAAALVAAGKMTAQGALTANALVLAKGALQTMFWHKMKLGTFALFVAIVCSIGYATIALSASNAGTQPPAKKKALPAEGEQPAVSSKPGAMPEQDAGRPIHSLTGHKDRIRSVAYSSDGQCIASASWDGTIRLWDPKTGKEVRRLDVPPTKSYNPAYLSQVLFSPDGEFVVVAQQSFPSEPGVIVWNRRTGERVRDLPGQHIAIAPDGKHIACDGWGTLTSTIRLYEFATGKLVREIHSPYSRVDLLVYSRDGNTLFAQVGIPRPPLGDGSERAGHDPAAIRAWDVATGKERRTGLDGAGAGHIAISPDGRTLALSSSLREAATGGERVGLGGHSHAVVAVAFSPDGRTVATGSMDGTVRLWDLLSGKEVGRFGKEVERFKGGWVLTVAFSPDGRTVASGGLDKTVLVWDVSKITGRRRESAERSPAELEADWKDLSGDAAKGYAAVGRLVSSGKQAVPFLGKQLQSAKPPDTKRIERLIGDLDGASFQVREQAARELTALGELAVPFVQQALAGNASLEARRRLEALLDHLEKADLSAETVRQIRAVEVLEFIGTSAARRLLEKLAAGPAEMRLTLEARAAAARLGKRSLDVP